MSLPGPARSSGYVKTEPLSYARVVAITFRPETLDEAAERFLGVSTPLVRNLPGSLSIVGGADRRTGSTWSISLWHTREDLERSNADPEVTQALTGYGQWMAGPFSVQSFEVVDMVFPDPDPAATGEFGRVTTLVTQPGCEAEVIAALRDHLARVHERSRECLGTLLMVPHIGQQMIAFELWASRAALEAADARIADQRIRLPGTVERLPTRETIEIFGRH